jgi:hypothetical protein
LVEAMTASATPAKENCAMRRPRPPAVPGIPGRSFMSTPVGCPTRSGGGGASTGCTAGLLANIADRRGSAPLVFPRGRALASFSLAGAGWVGGAEDFLGARGIWEKGIARRRVSCAAGRRDKMREKAKTAK